MTYEELAKELAQKAGQIIKDNFKLGMKKEWKADNSPVTATDLAVNKMVIEEVKKYFPEHDVRGEEESSINNNSEYLWVCDPVDGTMPFSHGVPLSTFSLALVHNGESILGVIYDPHQERLFFAERGKGTTLNAKKITVSDSDRGCIDLETMRLLGLIQPLYDKDWHIFKYGSCTFGGILVACGEFVATVYKGTQCHDVAALKVIVEEAGGRVTGLFGEEQRYDQDINGAIISNGVVHEELTLLIGDCLS